MIGLGAGTIKVSNWVPSGGGTAGAAAPSFQLVSLNAIPRPRSQEGSTTEVTLFDCQAIRTAQAVVFQDHQMQILFVGTPGGSSSVEWSSSNTGRATVNGSGLVTHLTDGTVIITATLGGQSLSVTLSLYKVSGSEGYTLAAVNAGTLAAHCIAAVDSRIASASAGTALALFTSQVHTGTPAYVRNTSAWCADLAAKLTCISAWNTTGGSARCGVAISPRHILFAAHFQISPGATVRFVTAGNVIVDRVMVSSRTHPDAAGQWFDITIGLLDSPLPGSITPCKILPEDWYYYLPGISEDFHSPNPRIRYGIPGISSDAEKKALVSEVFNLAAFAACGIPANASKRLEFYETLISGDSGSPLFLIINGELVLLATWYYGGAGSGPSVVRSRDVINAMMSELGGVNSGQLTSADLTGFPRY